MKGILCFVLLWPLILQAQEINFSETDHDFGVIREEEGSVYHDFYFMNTGDQPLRIKTLLTSCGCISSAWPREAIQPGEKAFIRLAYDPLNRNEPDFCGVAEIYSNAKNVGTSRGVHHLKISANVTRKEKTVTSVYCLQAEKRKPAKVKKEKEDVFDLILHRMQEEMLEGTDVRQNDKKTEESVALLRRGGMWADLDYRCFFRTNWEPVQHLDRVYCLALSYVHPCSVFYGNDTLFVAIKDALEYWVRHTPKSHNWWYNEIAVPQRLGDISVLLDAGEKKMPLTLRGKIFNLMAWPDPRKWTGANKQDIALHHLQRGCMLKNDSIVKVAAEQIFYPIRFTDREGLQVDYSYQQHGNQLYIGGYGTVFVNCIVKTAGWLRNTSYALRDRQLDLFSGFIRNAYLSVFRGPYMDYSVLGRGVSREGAVESRVIIQTLDRLKLLDTAHVAEYEQWRKCLLTGKEEDQRKYSRVYWRSDYAVHNQGAYHFSVRTSSRRTYKIESGNGENLYGALLSDGAVSIRRKGDEYKDIFPLWDWNLIPGVTAPRMENLNPATWGRRGNALFSGGLSDGEYSVMAYHMNEYGTEARKAWFMFEKEVVCLGAGITGRSAEKVYTTVNQCWLRGPVRSGGQWMMQDRILYYFPGKQSFAFSAGEQSGCWNKINYNESERQVKDSVFKLWLEHGERPQNAEYAYIMFPGVADITECDIANVSIERNDSCVQAVWQKKSDVLQVVFYTPATFRNEKVCLQADQPCIVQVKGVKRDFPEVYVADPMQDKEGITIHLKTDRTDIRHTVVLPEGERKGSTKKIDKIK